ncbi:hypothetical protein [Pseudoxanthomonas sp. X-1]|uniref:hypothetical protein n=1 Tax=Pseudoxanthomonas sp. X-1 TaxID=2571115 RepID=UPI00110BD0B9|nr:hypothetical protein [Pseudoxanthomonas sp. X-1]TMN18502.1 hypothetical protein FF950_14575 [Pseudoxanthomonas sp. X-1]UAY75991.1 hypothetical protein LAJ50_07075 [Pseudoxanthomonas sp. X-1]
MSQVIVFPRGQLSSEDRARMEAIGVVAVEVDTPSEVVTIIPAAAIHSPDDMLMSALTAVNETSYDSVSKRFASELYRRMKNAEARRAQQEASSDE